MSREDQRTGWVLWWALVGFYRPESGSGSVTLGGEERGQVGCTSGWFLGQVAYPGAAWTKWSNCNADLARICPPGVRHNGCTNFKFKSLKTSNWSCSLFWTGILELYNVGHRCWFGCKNNGTFEWCMIQIQSLENFQIGIKRLYGFKLYRLTYFITCTSIWWNNTWWFSSHISYSRGAK
jgi:hypothetical protein